MIFCFVIPGRHWLTGLSMMVVSIISTGAGSVADSERPSLPATEATSGVVLMTLSCHAMMRCTSVSEVAGSSTGMNSSEPSSSVGMNSEPKPVRCRANASGRRAVSSRGIPKATRQDAASRAPARLSTVLRWPRAQLSAGS